MNRRRLPPTLSACFALSALLCCSRPASSAWFVRGDLNASGALNITDAMLLLRSLFQGGQDAARCQDATDVNDDGALGLADAVHLLGHLFLQGPRPGPNDLFPGCWFDGTQDGLDCAGFAPCNPVGVVFACNRSASMGLGNKLQRMKDEVTEIISHLSDDDEVAAVLFDGSLVKFPPSGGPVHATQDAKAAAGALVSSAEPGSGTCTHVALLNALTLVHLSGVAHRVIIHLSDGILLHCSGFDPTPGSALVNEVTSRNTRRAQINTVCIGADADESWMKLLSSQNSGHHVWIKE